MMGNLESLFMASRALWLVVALWALPGQLARRASRALHLAVWGQLMQPWKQPQLRRALTASIPLPCAMA